MTAKYDIIYMDPPWRYRNWTDKVNGAAKSHYDVFTVDQLAALRVGELAAENCALFMWITHPKMVEGHHCVLFDAWGFRAVSTAFNWVKTNRDGSPYMGIGFYTRGDSELCLLGIKGSMKRANKDVRQTITSPRLRHSAKPNDEVRSRITRLFGDGLRCIELFARPPVPDGWDALGYEIDGRDIREIL